MKPSQSGASCGEAEAWAASSKSAARFGDDRRGSAAARNRGTADPGPAGDDLMPERVQHSPLLA